MGPIFLLLTVLIWGTAFLAQKSGADHLGPFAMTAIRNVLGAVFLGACIAVRWIARRDRAVGSPFHRQERRTAMERRPYRRSVFAGVACGLPLFFAMYAQQVGIETITPGVSAFLTANYVLFVPLAAAVLLRRRIAFSIWAGVALALVGTWFISMDGESLSLGKGEAWTILCALLFAGQMLVVDHFAGDCDVLVMSFVQLLVGAVLGFACLPFSREWATLSPAAVKAAGWALFYVGVMSSGVAYTLQNFGQARTPPALAALICSLESVVSALAGWLWRGDILSGRQALGCSLVFAALLVYPCALLLRGIGESGFLARWTRTMRARCAGIGETPVPSVHFGEMHPRECGRGARSMRPRTSRSIPTACPLTLADANPPNDVCTRTARRALEILI